MTLALLKWRKQLRRQVKKENCFLFYVETFFNFKKLTRSKKVQIVNFKNLYFCCKKFKTWTFWVNLKFSCLICSQNRKLESVCELKSFILILKSRHNFIVFTRIQRTFLNNFFCSYSALLDGHKTQLRLRIVTIYWSWSKKQHTQQLSYAKAPFSLSLHKLNFPIWIDYWWWNLNTFLC